MDDEKIFLEIYPNCVGFETEFSKMAFKYFQQGLRYREKHPLKQESQPKKDKTQQPVKHKYGEYQHVLLTDQQYENLDRKVDDREKWIKILDESIEEKGNIYKIKNFYLAALKWYKRDTGKNGDTEDPEKRKRLDAYYDKMYGKDN